MPTLLPRYTVIEKAIGETPLQALEGYRSRAGISTKVPLAYAGRLDPLASGKLLVLIGDECKRQTEYHTLDKRYQIEVVFGIGSDTGDVMGLLQHPDPPPTKTLDSTDLRTTLKSLRDTIELPYPIFSAKTVHGKPLHTWAMEDRLHEITIPTKRSTIYSIQLNHLTNIPAKTLYDRALDNINSIPPVTESRKALGNDFRRSDIRTCWQTWLKKNHDNSFQIANITCIVSSGTYMRTLAGIIAQKHSTCGLALSIHRTHIGRYQPLIKNLGVWKTKMNYPDASMRGKD